MKETELKPCPFCGSSAEIKEGYVYMDKAIRERCTKGCVSTKPILIDHPKITYNGKDESTRYTNDQAKDKAAEIWNRRSDNE